MGRIIVEHEQKLRFGIFLLQEINYISRASAESALVGIGKIVPYVIADHRTGVVVVGGTLHYYEASLAEIVNPPHKRVRKVGGIVPAVGADGTP